MTIEFKIAQLERQTSDGFVTTVHWTASKTEGENTVGSYGTIGFEVGTPETPFASLTEAQVIAWVKDKLGEEVVEAALAAQIEAQKNPVSASGLPWSQA
jgi:hypothetical protein